MLAHDFLDGLARLVGVVERDSADIVVEDMSLDDTVEELSTDETKFTIDSCSCTANVVPASSGIMRKRRVGVLKEGYGNYLQLADVLELESYAYQASGSPKGRVRNTKQPYWRNHTFGRVQLECLSR